MTNEELAEIDLRLKRSISNMFGVGPKGIVRDWYNEDVPKLVAEVERLQRVVRGWKRAVEDVTLQEQNR